MIKKVYPIVITKSKTITTHNDTWCIDYIYSQNRKSIYKIYSNKKWIEIPEEVLHEMLNLPNSI